ncbi:MAG: 30S ribosomal protein S5 [Candidatus Nanoarchaeia archaeon]
MEKITRKAAREKHPGEDVAKVDGMQKELAVEEKAVLEEKAIIEVLKEVTDVAAEERGIKIVEKEWKPKTEMGRKVASGEITNIDEILNSPQPFLESEIADRLIPNLTHVLICIGQSKGKFGGGKRSIWKQTQKKTKEGNKPKFSTLVVVGNHNGYVGIGLGKAKETVPAREKAIKNAKLNIIKIKFGCGSWACGCGENHTIPFAVSGGCGSVRVTFKPAPKGTGLIVEKELRNLLEMAGIKDVYSKTFGTTNTKLNLLKAGFEALKQLNKMKVQK